MILSELKRGGVRSNRRYFKVRYICHIVAPKGGPMHEVDSKINDLQTEVRKPKWTSREKATFISEAT